MHGCRAGQGNLARLFVVGAGPRGLSLRGSIRRMRVMRTTPKKLLILMAVACMAMLTACNTVKGFGKDVKKVGEQMEEKAG